MVAWHARVKQNAPKVENRQTTVVSGDFAAAWNDGLMVSITAKLGATTLGSVNFTFNTTTRARNAALGCACRFTLECASFQEPGPAFLKKGHWNRFPPIVEGEYLRKQEYLRSRMLAASAGILTEGSIAVSGAVRPVHLPYPL
jgi:hypothetical protein